MNTINPSVAAAVDQMEATMRTVRRLTEQNRLLADPVAGDRYIVQSLAENVHGQWTDVDHARFDLDETPPASTPRVTRADHAGTDDSWPAEARTVPIEVADRRDVRPTRDFCYRCLNPLHPEGFRKQPYRVLWVGKGVYIAEFHFCEANCVPYFERVFPTIKWEDNDRAV